MIHRQLRRTVLALVDFTLLPATLAAQDVGAFKQAPPLPLSRAARPTTAAITAADLMTRLYVLADDSMLGRQAGGLGNVRATDYIAAQAKRIGLRPAGEEGSYFQTIPLVTRTPDTTSVLRAGADTLALRRDYFLIPGLPSFHFGWGFAGEGVPTIYAGCLADSVSLTPEQIAGKVLVFAPRSAGRSPPFDFYSRDVAWERYRGAALVLVAILDIAPPFMLQQAYNPWPALVGAPMAGAPAGVVVSAGVAERLFGKPLHQLRPGDQGLPVTGRVGFVDHPTPYPARNVVALLLGRNPRLRAEYVALGAHSDHVGTGAAVPHDSLEAYNRVMRAGDGRYNRQPTAEQWTRILELRDSLRAVRPERSDSVFNGAEDDATGSAALLEVAERLAAGPRPWRSILFVWHTAEEIRYLGAEWFTEHPTVPRNAIVAEINLDGVGKRLPTRRDFPDAVQGDLFVVGAGRLSNSFGKLVDDVATRDGIVLDPRNDAPGDPSDYYCRSDHYHYARFGIPAVFFTVGAEFPAYHQLNDEAQYIDYGHLERVTRFAADLTGAVADLDRRPALDSGRPSDPYATCIQ